MEEVCHVGEDFFLIVFPLKSFSAMPINDDHDPLTGVDPSINSGEVWLTSVVISESFASSPGFGDTRFLISHAAWSVGVGFVAIDETSDSFESWAALPPSQRSIAPLGLEGLFCPGSKFSNFSSC